MSDALRRLYIDIRQDLDDFTLGALMFLWPRGPSDPTPQEQEEYWALSYKVAATRDALINAECALILCQGKVNEAEAALKAFFQRNRGKHFRVFRPGDIQRMHDSRIKPLFPQGPP